jgi:hypothetical protein
MDEITLTIGEDGAISMIYNDDLLPLLPGEYQITRAAHVEPTANGRWQIHFCHKPEPEPETFERRDQALKREVELVNQYLSEGVI